MKVLTRLLLVAAAILVAGSFAATAHAATVEGTLIAVSGTTPPAMLTVQMGTTTYTVNVSTTTTIVRKFNGASSLDEFAIGDMLRVIGTVTGTNIDATYIKNLSIQRKDASQWGTILTIDATAKTFTFDPMHKKNLANQTVLTTSATKIFQGNRKGASFADLKVGMTIKVIGLWRKTQAQLVADRILIKLTELEGMVSAVDCASTVKTITVSTESKEKKLEMTTSEGNSSKKLASWVVSLTDKTVIRGKNMVIMSCADVKAGHKVSVRGLKTGTGMLDAISIYDKGGKRNQNSWEGTIGTIDAATKSFTMGIKSLAQTERRATVATVNTTAETIYVDENGKPISFGSLAAGHKLQIKGSIVDLTITANLIIDKDLPLETED